MLLKYLVRALRDQRLGFINQPELDPFTGGVPTFNDESYVIAGERGSVAYVIGGQRGKVEYEDLV